MSLVFALILSLIGALMQSAVLHQKRTDQRTVTMLALESCFAEYDTSLLEHYEIFGRKGSESEICNRLSYYGATGIQHEVGKVEYLTDHAGAPFYHQAIRHMRNKLGVDWLFPEPRYEESVEEQEQSILERLEELLTEHGADLSVQENPVYSMQSLRTSNLLPLLVEDATTLSNRSIETEDLPTVRELQEGNFGTKEEEHVTDPLFFTAYVQDIFTDYTDEKEEQALLYEQEYLLGGQESDQANLERVCRKILTVRTALNYGYLLTDSAKQSEAEALALTLCSLLAVPEITEVLKQAILLAWAYGESIVDVRVLLKGKKVPTIKTSGNWQLQLVHLVNLGTPEEVTEEKEEEAGLSYSDYMKGFLLLADRKSVCMRSLDLMEVNHQIRTDQCITRVQIQSTAGSVFQTEFGYQ